MSNSLQVITNYYKAKFRQQFRDRNHLEVWQKHRLDRALQRAAKIFPYYREMKGWPYESLPITDKKTHVDHFHEMNSLGISFESAMNLAIMSEESRDFSGMIGNTAIGLSTGTSGARGIFLTQKRERLRWAGTVLAKSLPGSIWKRKRIAFVFRANNPLYSTVQSKRIDFRFLDLMQPLADLLQALQRFSPEILIAPGRVLREISSAQNTGKINIGPEHIIAVSEVLEDQDKFNIEAAFGVKVHQIYQATEGFLAASCPLGTLHLNEDLLYFERQWLDSNKRRFVPIITDFFRESQAIVRYRLNDVLLVKDSPCPCGSILLPIEKVEGRCDDVIFLRGVESKGLKPVFPDTLRNAVVKSKLRFSDFQILQSNEKHILFRFDPLDQLQDEVDIVADLSRLFRDLAVVPPTISVERQTCFDLSKKHRRIERQFSVSKELI